MNGIYLNATHHEQRGKLTWMRRKCENISICRFCMMALSVFVQQKSFLYSHHTHTYCQMVVPMARIW